MSTFWKKLFELDDLNKPSDDYHRLLDPLSDEMLNSTLKSKLYDTLMPRALSIIFTALSGNSYKKKKVDIMTGVLEEIPRQAALTSVQIRDITNSILVELENLDTDSLVQLVSFCTKQMGEDEDSGKEMWKEMMPQLLLLLKEKPVVNHCGHDMSGADYKSQVIKSLCNTEWKSDSVTMIAAMFRELPLAGEEFKQVVDKLLHGLKDLDASEVPPFMYQMLRLCGNQHFLLVLMHAEKYFKKSAGPVGSANQDVDSIETVMTENTSAEFHQSESTVLFHIQKCAVQEPQSSRNLASCFTQLAYCPEILFGSSTFLLSSALMICDIEILREKYMTIVVNSLVRCVQEEEIIKKHVWTHNVLASQDQMEGCLKKLIENTDLQRGVILEQFVKFCFEILVNKKTGKAADKALITVSNALIHVAKKQPDAISVILELLVCNIVRSKADPQLLRCLKKLVAMTPTKLLIKTEFISIKLVEQLVNMQPLMAEQAIVALIPLLSRSEGLTNNLVVNLRKAINRPLVSITNMAISSLLTIIQQLRIKKFNVTNSQATQQYSNNSACSQMTGEITMHGAASVKELGAIHLELMQILTPALSCQAEARLRLYEGIHRLPQNNQDLGPIVLSFLFKNLEKCREIDGVKIIDYEKCYKVITDEEVILIEPVGHLVFSISMVLCHMKNAKVTDNVAKEIDTLLENLVELMAHLKTKDLGNDELVIAEGSKGEIKLLVFNLAMNVCEALIAYMVKTWADNKNQLMSKKIGDVFNTYMDISNHLKGCKRPTKKKDLNATTQGTQQVANPRKRGRPGIFTAVKDKGAKEIGGVALGPVLDLSSLHLLLELLYCEDADWADKNKASVLQNKREFHTWVLSSLMLAINHFKVLGANGVMEKTSPDLIYFGHIGKIMFDLLSTEAMKEMVVDNVENAILFMESLHELVNLFLLDNQLMFETFIAMTGNGNVAETADRHVIRLLKVLGELLKMMESEEELDVNFKKLPRLTLAILTQMLNLLDHSNPVTEKMVKWLQKAAKDITCNDEQVVKGILELLLSSSELRGRSIAALTAFTKDVLAVLGQIERNDDYEKKLKLIGEAQVNGVIQVICSRIRHTLDLINILIQRLRSERCLHPYQVNDVCEKITAEVEDKEMSVSESLISILDIVKMLLNAKMGVEQGEALLRDVCALYRTTTNYCRHFAKVNRFQVNLRRSKFNVVVAAAGRYLPPLIAAFITHLEDMQKEKYGDLQGKKKFNAKVAQKKVLRESDTFARTMLENERFSKAVFQLSAKLKDPSLKDSLHMGLCFDFRLNYDELAGRLQELRDEEVSDDGGDDADGGVDADADMDED